MAPEIRRSDVTLANWRTTPYCRWSFQNVAELVPSATVGYPAGGAKAVRPDAPDGIVVDDPASGRRISASDYFALTEADCFLALKDSRPVASWCAGHADFDAPHVIFSISKSVTGLMAGIAQADGALDPGAPVSAYVELPATCGYADARVRDLLDMTVAIDFDEEYLDADGAFDRYRRAMLWNPEHAGKPETMETVLASLGRGEGEHGRRFYYASPNTDMLGLVIERATGLRFHRYLAERLWGPMGAQGAAYVTVDRAGTARAAGGLCVTVSDLARLGQLVLDGGKARDGRQVVPAGWIDDLRNNGSREAWRIGNFADTFENGRYRSCWYSADDDHNSFCGVGIHGQWIWADPETGVVMAKTASRNVPSDDAATARDIAVLGQIARRL